MNIKECAVMVKEESQSYINEMTDIVGVKSIDLDDVKINWIAGDGVSRVHYASSTAQVISNNLILRIEEPSVDIFMNSSHLNKMTYSSIDDGMDCIIDTVIHEMAHYINNARRFMVVAAFMRETKRINNNAYDVLMKDIADIDHMAIYELINKVKPSPINEIFGTVSVKRKRVKLIKKDMFEQDLSDGIIYRHLDDFYKTNYAV